jgi:hypothetical protein
VVSPVVEGKQNTMVASSSAVVSAGPAASSTKATTTKPTAAAAAAAARDTRTVLVEYLTSHARPFSATQVFQVG